AQEVDLPGPGPLVATQLVLGLVEPQSSGIGGGAFLLHYEAANKRVTAYDARETAPAAATGDQFLRPDGTPMDFYEAVVGGLSVGVPGVLRMLELAQRDHGSLPWAKLFQPAIRLAEDGFAITPRLHRLIAEEAYLATFPESRAYFYQADGSAKPVGTILRNPAYARTLRAVAEEGADAFYGGAIAADIVARVRGAELNPGRMSLADLRGYQAKRRAPLCRGYRAVHRVCGMPPPTSGGATVLMTLGILENFDLAALGQDSPAAWHLIAEASRLAFADRNAYLADSDFVAVPLEALLEESYLRRRAALIAPERVLGTPAPGLETAEAFPLVAQYEPPSTTHFSIVDGDGNAVSMTSSVENAFGSRMMVRGFILNNQLTDFSFQPEADGQPVANRVEPGKRPRSSMSPTLVLDSQDNLRLAVGSPGGSRIIGYVTKALLGVLDWNLDIQAAIDLPNAVTRSGPTDLEEDTAARALARPLEALGHETKLRELTSGLHGIEAKAGTLHGGADPRREGVVLRVP
ncbi:MAG: gamma-glutamyltransferase, partial [Rhodovibrionaceae bacterium]